MAAAAPGAGNARRKAAADGTIIEWVRLMRTPWIVPVLLLLASCGGSSSAPAPLAPLSPTSPGSPAQSQITGRVTDAISGAAVAGASVKVGPAAAVTSGADGGFRVDMAAGTAVGRLLTTINATGFIPRDTYITPSGSGTANVSIDLLPDREPFSLAFYREMVRDGFESPLALEPIRRWTTNPRFYLNTMNPRTGQPLRPSEVEELVLNIRDAVAQATGGLLAAGEIETGAAGRSQRLGTINIDIRYEPDEEYCGSAFVGANPGSILLNYERCASPCGGRAIGPELVAHEVGHALGFWHVEHGVMQATDFVDCARVNFTAPERLHGSLAYRRPTGNTDMDVDPRALSSLGMFGEAPLIRCPRRH